MPRSQTELLKMIDVLLDPKTLERKYGQTMEELIRWVPHPEPAEVIMAAELGASSEEILQKLMSYQPIALGQ
ncbi:hypothetical protein [Deinococcus cellulosilyticus]|uniref:Uncharacterized protein n=1 Tax=Deinococcus cellulosilyticus (strain DSM 18568 / NBRC 106333 / KACC 11606 / 5516J-15) TaxID=1223518 RepID=A0A511NBD7_DEIC1|nr:hypothetical protein [Deinococcus cellulosilyticus]GEM50122.1 hypothetical protein DC3_57570 [Deinococcus cellulosilyticus NBRC 106333 = KACC 11606]